MMNRWLSLFLYLVFFSGLIGVATPVTLPPPPTGSGEASEHDELSPAQEQAMWNEIHRNIELLRSTGVLPAPDDPQIGTYIFPLLMIPGLPDYAGFKVSAFSDHDSNTGQVLDYNGGDRTYDGHRGTDYGLWPFPWNKLDAGEMQVIAVAEGTIVGNSNVDPTDHNCLVSSPDPWNYVALVHPDGRMTIYGHMRYNSLTPKGIGETVAQGEYLGTVASSGNSSGPHLHFEVREGSFTNAEWVDPYAGPESQPETLWAAQRPYFDSAINRLTTHASPPLTPDPCQPTTINLQDSFTTPDTIYFYTYYRDFQGILPTQFNLYRPDGTLFQSSVYTPGDIFYPAWSNGWVANFSNNEPGGTWRFEALYNGQAYETFFNVNAPTTLSVTSPNGGEQWERQNPHTLTWADNLGGDVNITLYHNDAYIATLASNTPSDGEYLWTPDPALALGSGYTLRMTSVINPSLYDESDAPFTLADALLVAHNDFGMTPLNTPITLDVLGNDGNPGDSLTITTVGIPTNGTAIITNNHIVYTPTLGFLGMDVFTYTASSSTEQAEATVTVLVVNEVFRVFMPVTRR